MSNIWRPRPPSFPLDSRIPFTAAEVNEFDDIDDLRIKNDDRNPSEESIEMDSIQNPKLLRAQDSVFIRHKQRDSIVSNTAKISDEESNSGSVRNVRFSFTTPLSEEIDNEVFEPEEEVVLRNKSVNSTNSFVYQPNPSNDSDSDEEMQNIRRNSEIKKPWDVFKTLPPPDDDETLDGVWVEFFIKCLKIFAYFFTFVVTLGSAVLSKSLILLMTSMIRVNRTISLCDEHIYDITPELDPEKKYNVVYRDYDPERIVWLWCLFFAVIAPDIFALGRSLRICYFKTYQVPTFDTFLTVFLFESLHAIGISLLVFLILPTIDVIKGSMMTNSLCLIPAILLLLKQNDFNENKHLEANEKIDTKPKFAKLELILTIGATICQLIGLIVYPLVAYFDDKNSNKFWYLPLALVLVSFTWWENFLNSNSNNILIQKLLSVKKDLAKTRYFTYVLISIWKIIVIFSLMILIVYLNDGKQAVDKTFSNFVSSFQSNTIEVIRDKTYLEETEDGTYIMTINDPLIPVWILLIQISTTYMCYAFAKFSCKIHIQTFSYAVPVNLAVPVTVSFLWAMVEVSIDDKCQLCRSFNGFQYIFWFTEDSQRDTLDYYHNWNNYVISFMWVLSLASQVIISIHIWTATSARLASTEELFVNPMYSSVLIDQSLALNRRRINLRKEIIQEEEDEKEEYIKSNNEDLSSNLYESVNDDLSLPVQFSPHNSDETIRIFVCATLWHENKEEMIQMLKAVMRLDEDQCIRRNAKNFFELSPTLTDYYEIEFNLYFDDAFDQGQSDDEDDRVINRFVKQLIETMDEAASNVHGTLVHLLRPILVPTPYGGKLEWTLPGQNKLVAHLKDKILIRHRKRWSQCMYMYYLLGHRIAERPIDERRKEMIAMNTFILALDGDINFRPHALHLIVDLMKKNKRLGAACGRIHPIGSGPMVWYQKFEYAIGHWLQKATEHVFGCVLCSPGCFSLFRARAVMDDSVMNKYTTKPTEALHYVQYDQGEDRWLCTLLLQQGWRIEYCAASDSYTHAPEGFGEFYTQRRRWAPSTTANIIDLLSNYRQTVATNTDISNLYVLYQAMLLMGTVLSPGTIFLMVVSAMNSVMGLNTDICFSVNIVLILLFSIICLVCQKNDYIIFVAMILSTIYALLMLAVLVGTAIDINQRGVLTPNSLFFLGMMGSFVLAALLHPQEFACLLPLILYMLLIPSMYLLLTIYSVTNMHIVSWGTREVKSKLTAKEAAAAALAAQTAAEDKNKKRNLLGFLDFKKYGNKSGLFTCMCCSNGRAEEETEKLINIGQQLNQINDNINNIKSNIEPRLTRRTSSILRRKSGFGNREQNDVFGLPMTVPEEDEDVDIESISETTSLLQENSREQSPSIDETNCSPNRPKWTRDPIFKKYPFVELSPNEKQFWEEFIPKYLLPLDENPREQARIASDLKELRNKMVFTFSILNIVFVLFVYLLQMHRDVFGIELPAGIDHYNDTYDEQLDKHIVVPIYKHIIMDPIGLILIVFFGSILVIQLFGMFLHRFKTLAHLLAFTHIDYFKQKPNLNENISEKFNQNAIQLTRKLQKQGISELNEPEIDVNQELKPNPKPGRAPLTRQLSVFAKPQAPQPLDLNEAFRKRVMSIRPDTEDVPNLQGLKRKSVGQILLNRRNTVDWRRISIGPERLGRLRSTDHSSRSTSVSSNIVRPKSLTFQRIPNLEVMPKLSETLQTQSQTEPEVIETPVSPTVQVKPNSPPVTPEVTGQHSIAYYNFQQNIAKNLSENILRNSLQQLKSPDMRTEVKNTNPLLVRSNSKQLKAQNHSNDSSIHSSVSSNIDFNFDAFEESDNSSLTAHKDNDFPVKTFQPTTVRIDDKQSTLPTTSTANRSNEISTKF